MKKARYELREDNYKYYITNILKSNPPLSPEEEYKVARKVSRGDQIARKRLIECNLKLVIKIAMHFLIPGVNIMDLIQEGNVGLIIAVDKFNYKRHVKFSTYASAWIKQSIFRFLIKHQKSIKLPLRKGEMLIRIKKGLNHLMKSLNRYPTVEEISSESGLEKKKVEELLGCLAPCISLNEAIKQNFQPSLMSGYVNEEYHPETIAIRNLLKEETSQVLKTLMEREAEIIKYRFGFHDGKIYSLKQTGEIIGLSPESIRQIEMKALEKIRKKFSFLKDYLSG
ncbi:MAG: RNA polymerase sigma factor RpoD/SigA [Spirochaetes bacterium]|nr:RNA polymerase sigma factor RpoD/SigA [Spirochaetota bacterium]